MTEEDQAPRKSPLTRSPFWLISASILAAGIVFYLFLPGSPEAFHQDMLPLGDHPILTALVAFIPSLVLMVLMGTGKLRSISVVLISLAVSLFLALFVWRMPPILAGHSILFGMTVAVFPLLWALLNAMWIFRLLTDSGHFETLRQSLQRVSPDKRVQTVLVGFGLTALIESIAAFGAPIVIVTAMLIGLGFPPQLAAAISLISDSTPGAWGTQGMPILMLSSVTGLDTNRLGTFIGWQTSLIASLLPIGAVIMVSGWKGFKGIWPLPLLAGFSYGLVGLLCSQFLSISITGMAAGLASVAVILLATKLVKPRSIWLFPGQELAVENQDPLPRGKVLRAWSPFIVLITVMGLVNGTGLVKLISGLGNLTFAWPKLNQAVFTVDPHTGFHVNYPAAFSQNLLTAGGTLTLIAGWISAPLLGLKPRQVLKSYWGAFKGMLMAGSTIACILGLAYLMNYSGMAASIGLAVSLVSAGALSPLMVVLGFMGCIMSGSVSGGNALFGGASLFASQRLGLDPHLIAGTLCSGGTLAKPITPQSLVLAEAAIGHQETDPPHRLISRLLGWVAFYMVVMIIIVYIQSLFV